MTKDVIDPSARGATAVDAPAPHAPFGATWPQKLALLAITILLLSLSFAPIKQFYLAWIGIVPWLLVLRGCRSQKAAFFWSWIGGTIFFIANMWWLWFVTGPGMIALMMFLGLYWAGAGTIIRGARLLEEDGPPQISVILIGVIWVAFEWLRSCFPFSGLPWLFLGHAQSPILAMCQIADFSGVFGISFWVAMINAFVAVLIIRRFDIRPLIPAGVVTLVVLAATLGYGIFRMSERTTSPGPTVLVIQPNYPQSNTGEKGASAGEIIKFHLEMTERALASVGEGKVDLVVWSETMLREMNRAYRAYAHGFSLARNDGTLEFPDYGEWLDTLYQKLGEVCRKHHVAMLVGGMYADPNEKLHDRRNSAYLYSREGAQDEKQRYDKIHLVPWGEYIPFKQTFPPLYSLFVWFVPASYGGDSYTLTAGDESKTTPFAIPSADGSAHYRFVTPICFEDLDAALVARLLYRDNKPSLSKAGDFIVNITNDGWFKANEMPQHFQAAIFRSIENRVPTARSVNTGISGFVDSVGGVDPKNIVPANEEGWRVATLMLDSRVTFYTRFGDAFAILCFGGTTLLAIVGIWRVVAKSKAKASEHPTK